MKSAVPVPGAAFAEVRIVADSPESARRVAEVLRRSFASTEQRSYPTGPEGGTRLHITVDTTHSPGPAESDPPWLVTSTSAGDRPHADEV
ncbi:MULTISPECIES: hypothetical protein [unclassified Streptomyces]|uniref:hypothetical protein n=1 Tax=unclassified Streptomyces TaxID=2593676 RepID=UPI002DD860BF|nr:hypothetical protein [Streptomyces sp. NBC_01750]WSB01864.1 hypothetical protein OIE54_22705 [Streptomyces sp. NBC_01794]WSD33887.1 hypothetical protein OG966_19510 [Streptomyces sp. NBC_01750]